MPNIQRTNPTGPHVPTILGLDEAAQIDLTPALRAIGIEAPLTLPAGSESLAQAQAFIAHLRAADSCHTAPHSNLQRDAMLGMLVLAMHGLPADHMPSSRHFVIEALDAIGTDCPAKYRTLLEQTPADEPIKNMRPWFFLPSPGKSVGYCSSSANLPLLPFCQALEHDLMACFDTNTQRVLVINPWARDKDRVIVDTFNDFDTWLTHAQHHAQSPGAQAHSRITELDFTTLSRMVSHILRHEPWLYELELDPHGWVNIPELTAALANKNPQFGGVTEADLATMISLFDKKRHEIADGRIRALYGHSTPQKLLREPAKPPEVLYHGTSPEVAKLILREGLKPMTRQFVHMSPDKNTAMLVGARKADRPVLLAIRADHAHGSGVAFYRGNEQVWLADEVPPEFIEDPSAR